jgi:hypothetical protein
MWKSGLKAADFECFLGENPTVELRKKRSGHPSEKVLA